MGQPVLANEPFAPVLIDSKRRRFLESAIDGDNSGQSMILEIK